jgi:hypothetical protein
MTTTVPVVRPSMENLKSVSAFSEALINLGYPIRSINEQSGSITSVIEVKGQRYPVLIDIDDDSTNARIEVKIANAGNLPEDAQSLASALLSLLALNSQIAPFAVAIYPSQQEDTENSEDAPITLIHSVPLGDLSTGELESAMMSCRRAIMLTTENICAYNTGSCGAGCGCHTTGVVNSKR